MKYFKFKETINSSKAKMYNIDNFPKDADIIDNIIYTMECLDDIRERYGKPLYITSGFRCPELNRLVGGKPTSQHLKGLAVDINLGSVSANKQFFEWCKYNVDFDLLINEQGCSWVHISFNKKRNRKQIVYA